MKRGKGIFTSAILLFGAFSFSQEVEWVKQVANHEGEFYHTSSVNAVCSDGEGNVISGGVFKGTFDFDPGEGRQELKSTGKDLYVSKLDANGNFVWVNHLQTMKGYKGSTLTSVSTDENGNVYAAGHYTKTLTVQKGDDVIVLPEDLGESGGKGLTNIFLVKYNSAGELQWANHFGSTYFDECTAMEVTSMGDIRMTGKFSETVDFDPSSGEKNLSAAENETGFYLAVYDLDGNYINASMIAKGHYGGTPKAMSSDKAGNTFVAGYFNQDISFKTVSGEVGYTGPEGGSHMYVAKMNKRGMVLWVQLIEGATYFNKIQSIVASDEGECFVAGTFGGTISSGSTSLTTGTKLMDLFVAKFDMQGNSEWMKMIDGTGRCNVSSINLDPTMNVFVSGTFEKSLTPENADMIESYGKTDGFVFRMTRNGDHMWSQHIKGGNSIYINSVYVDGMRKAHVAGSFVDVFDFGNNYVLDAHLMDKSFPAGDGFILKMK